jgi:hypothetical protein
MQQLTVKETTRDEDEDLTSTYYECDFVAQCNGTSIWANTAGRSLRVTAIAVHEYEGGYKMVNVTHDGTWDIYTDEGFEAAITAALGYAVSFTEQGMQEDGFASMETCM